MGSDENQQPRPAPPPAPRPQRAANEWLRWLLAVFAVVLGSASTPCAAAQWPDEYTSGQLTCHADFPLAPYRGLLDSVPALQRDLAESLGITPAREPIHLFLFQKKSTYQNYVKQYFPDVPSRKALFIKGRGPGMVFAHLGDAFDDDVRHECTHAFLNASLPMVPLWLDEGLAEYYEVPADRRVYGNSHLTSVKWTARFGQSPRLDVLEQVRDLNEMGRNRYRQAWAWVHFLLHGPPEARDELRRFLADIQALTPPGQLDERLRGRLPDLERQFLAHFQNWKP
jgi:hypothetical protein